MAWAIAIVIYANSFTNHFVADFRCSRSLLAIMTFTIVASLKHIKERIHVPA
jgi:uncharacterized membrane protein YoaT (DUF817 family)